MLRRSRGYVPASLGLPLAGAGAARVRRRAQEHLLPGQGVARLGRAPHRRPAELGDAALLPRGHRPLRRAVRDRARGARARPAPRLPLDRIRARARGRGAHRQSSITTPTSPPAWPSTESADRRSARSTTEPGSATDGTIWGGELLAGDLGQAERVGHLQPVRLPGGDAAVREPWRMACAWLLAALDGEAPRAGERSPHGSTRTRWEQVAELARSGTASPLTTSVGRLFDAVAALCGIRMTRPRRGPRRGGARRPSPPRASAAPTRCRSSTARCSRLDARETVRAIARATSRPAAPRRVVSARFHNGLADATASARRTAGAASAAWRRRSSPAASSRTACC